MLGTGAACLSFELKTTGGATQSSRTILEEGPALLFFFKVSCPVCQMTAPYLDRLNAGGSVQVIGISQDDSKATTDFNRRYGVNFPVLMDESRASYPVSNYFGISTVPSLFVVEQDGIISTAFSGFSKRDLEALGERMNAPPFLPEEKVPAFRAG